MASKHKPIQHINTTELFKLTPMSACVRMAIAGGVFFGSVNPGYAELPVPAQTWVTMGAAHMDPVVGDTLVIHQETDRAILQWDSFNVGANNKVDFQQKDSSSIALNRIFQDNPSQILGTVTANGQIYLYNKNGFVFHEGSVVDANTVVASTLNISDQVFNNGGIVNAFDNTKEAAFSGKPGQSKTIPCVGEICVEKGAKIRVGENGRIILAGRTVTNEGSLEADKFGQVILVASRDKVYLQPASSTSPFSGLLVEVGQGGQVTNNGSISVRQGNITLAGFAVNQNGLLNATTSVNVNGSIRLLAHEGQALDGSNLIGAGTDRKDLKDGLGRLSKVTFGSGSSTRIVADADGGKAIDEQTQPISYLEVSANTVHLQSGAAIGAPNGFVNIVATSNLLEPTNPAQDKKGRILLESGSSIDVSGTKGVSVSGKRNVIDVPVQSYELRDSPLQKGGVLQGQTVRIDIRKDTKIIDISGGLARIERSLNERLGKGGVINLTSSGDVIVNSNASINISGGSVDYKETYLQTTKLLTDYGKLVDISDADPNQHYKAVYGSYKEVHEKWGVEKIWQADGLLGKGLYQAAYTQGLDAGKFNIATKNLSWNGDLIAGSASGLYQREADDLAYGGAFTIDTKVFLSSQNVLFQTQNNKTDIAIEDKFPVNGKNGDITDLVISTDVINKSGIQKFSIKTKSGNASIDTDANIELGLGKAGQVSFADNTTETVTGSEFDVVANNITVKGDVYATGGKISLSAGIDSGATEESDKEFGEPGNLVLTSTAKLDVSGRWVNDFAQGLNFTPTEAIAINAGSVSLRSRQDLTAKSGSVVKANAGAWLDQNQKVTAGSAGEISFTAQGLEDSTLKLKGSIAAYGMTDGGSLSLSTAKLIVGNDVTEAEADKALVLGVTDGHLDLPNIEGFSKIALNSNSSTFGELSIKSNTALSLIQKNLVLSENFSNQASGKSIKATFSDLVNLPAHLRNPVDLSLSAALGVKVETGSSIVADNKANISINTDTRSVFIDGVIKAPAGTINVTVNAADEFFDPLQSIWIGKNADLSVAGSVVSNPIDKSGRRTGDVLDGGSISLNAIRGYVVLEEGSHLDVSGTKTTLDLPVVDGNSIQYQAQTVGSDAGKITLAAAEGIVLDGQIKGHSGTSTNKGGRIDVSLDRSGRNVSIDKADSFSFAPLTLNVRQNQLKTLDGLSKFGDDLDQLGLTNKATVSADSLSGGGFADVRLASNNYRREGGYSESGNINFVGDVNLKADSRIQLDSANITWEASSELAGNTVKLSTAFFKVGSSIFRETTATPELGNGVFNVDANWIELLGGSNWSGFNSLNLNSAHDLRTVGLLKVDDKKDGSQSSDYVGKFISAADINLTASQIYPTTLTKFTFANINNPTGKITIKSSGNIDASPLSAAGVLNFEAPSINQGGVIKAPFGTINLTATNDLTLDTGSKTSVSGANLLVPFGNTSNGLDWVYAITASNNLVFNTPPEKKLVLSAPQIDLKKGSEVDIAGGGDLYGYEFLPNNIGGTYDYLAKDSPSYNGGFAIVPSLGSSIAPYDPLQAQDYGDFMGEQVYLNGTDTLAAGFYTVLPAHYALLPGAYLITPQANSQDFVGKTENTAGLQVVSGYMATAGTDVKDSRTSAFLIESGADIRKHSAYDEHKANEFYVQKAARDETNLALRPLDSGQVTIKDVQTKLVLEGSFNVSKPTGGRGARLDIAANRLKIVNQLSATPTTGVLEVLADNLTNLKVDSLFLGGQRSNDIVTGATNLDITSEEVVFDNNINLHVTDLIAAATNEVAVKNGANLEASGSVNTGDTLLSITGDGALLRLSADNQVAINRTGSAPGSTGILSVESGATLISSKSMLIDATKSTIIDGDIQMQSGSLNLSANAINIGEVSGVGSGALNLSNAKLLGLSVDELVLNSRDTINFYGNVGKLNQSGTWDAITFKTLVINSAGFAGFGSSDKVANLQANKLTIGNTTNDTPSTVGNGLGQLNISATDYIQGANTVLFNGFGNTNFTVANGFTTSGTGVLKLDSDFNLTTGYLTAAAGSSLLIDAGVHNVSIQGNGSDTKPLGNNFGASIGVNAASINFNARAALPSGSLALHSSSGDVVVDSKADIDLSGKKVRFADVLAYTYGGTFNATADLGAIVFAKGSKLDLSSGGGNASGGKLNLHATNSNVDLSGQITANLGSAVIDVANFNANGGFDGLINTLNVAGINQSVYIRSHQADINQGIDGSLTANKITLVADKGAINVAGKLIADNSDAGGAIKLFAADKVSLLNGAIVSAKGLGDNSKGGKVLLSSTDADGDKQSGIAINSGSLIDVSGGAKSVGGKVNLQALRTDTDNNGVDDSVAIAPIAGTVQGFSQFYALAVKKYTNDTFGNDGEINTVDINTIKDDTDAYMLPATIQNTNALLGKGVQLQAGIEVDYTGDLTLKDKWDLVDWRYANSTGVTDLPGVLAINTSGNFNVENILTDGFKQDDLPGFSGKELLQTTNSWSYQVVAGSDLASADKQSLLTEAKNINFASNAVIRTGTGDIDVAASGDVIFQDKTSHLYIAGKAEEGNRFGVLSDGYVNFGFYGDYPLLGGDLTINAQHNIEGAKNQSTTYNDWLIRRGSWDKNDPDTRIGTSWAVDYTKFSQNVGGFGGGKVVVNAGDNINDLAVVMPTTGKQMGNSINDVSFITNVVQVDGGGDLSVNAGKDITGGIYYVGAGKANLTAGQSIKGSNSTTTTFGNALSKGPGFFIGDTNLTVNSNKDVSFAFVADPMILGDPANKDVQFFSYSADSSIALSSLSGDVRLGTDISAITSVQLLKKPQESLTKIYPSSLNAIAFGGSIVLDGIDKQIVLFPSAKGNLSLLARDNITQDISGDSRIAMSDYDPKLLPTAVRPLTGTQLGDQEYNSTITKLNPFSDSSEVHAQKALHLHDDEPVRVVTQQGDIKGLRFNVPKKAIFSAGRDISAYIDIQHANSKNDVSTISAGRDISYLASLDVDFGTLTIDTRRIYVAGSGDVLIQAGRNIDLGSSIGIATVGNTFNQNLSSKGANLTVLAGLNGALPNYLGLQNLSSDIIKYADNYNKYQELVRDFMRERTQNPALTVKTALEGFKQLDPKDYAALQPKLDALISNKYVGLLASIKDEIITFVKHYKNDNSLTDEQALSVYSGLNREESLSIQPVLNKLADKILFTELNQTGSASAADATAGNERGFAAIQALYPGNDWNGSLSLYFSKLQTWSGGNINLLVPGGDINAGLAAASGLNKTSSDLGIAAQGTGDVNAFLKNDFVVNESRVFALGGGDIAIWSSEGDIDAGRGAKSALAAPPPIVSFDANGNLVVTFPPVVSGSGIRTSAPIGKRQGNVSLFAPGGVVNAGEAGIAGKDVTISATAVLGSNNIQVGGVGSGVPAASSGSLAAGLTGVSNLTANVSQVAQAATDISKDTESTNKSLKLGTITVDLIGFGE